MLLVVVLIVTNRGGSKIEMNTKLRACIKSRWVTKKGRNRRLRHFLVTHRDLILPEIAYVIEIIGFYPVCCDCTYPIALYVALLGGFDWSIFIILVPTLYLQFQLCIFVFLFCNLCSNFVLLLIWLVIITWVFVCTMYGISPPLFWGVE